MGKIRVAIIGVGNCASSLIQGIEYYKNATDTDKVGLMNQAPTRESNRSLRDKVFLQM